MVSNGDIHKSLYRVNGVTLRCEQQVMGKLVDITPLTLGELFDACLPKASFALKELFGDGYGMA